MTNLRPKRSIAAGILKCGENRVWINPTRAADVAAAITKADIRRLINEGVIRARPALGVSRVRARAILEQKRKGRRKGPGSRKGAKFSRAGRKRLWISRIRALRKEMRRLKTEGTITPTEYRRLYYLADSGVLRSKAHLLLQVQKMKAKKE